MFDNLRNHWDKLDILVHSVAYAPADQISGDFVECANREGFRIAHDISAYSLIGLSQAALPMMLDTEGSILTLSIMEQKKPYQTITLWVLRRQAWKPLCAIWQPA